jgi:biotin carboxyl carrier protein|tara:strand:- start:1853 stop:2044 length:192 start_codon:yes stop_codon:yes gene_type:complete
MPGRVVRVMVSVGDEVVEQQELIVVEAMKMENALVAPRGGRVGEIAAHKGMVVEAGQLLATVE